MSYAPPDEHVPFRMTRAVLWLIAINVAVFFVQLTLQQDLPQTLGFEGFDRHRLWTPVTYMFAHAGFLHLALNMYTLWAFGPRVEQAWSPNSFALYYVWCGLGGLLLHDALLGGLAGRGGVLMGASGAIFGVMYAYARRWPDDEVLFFGVVPMKVKYMVWGMVVVNLILGGLAMSSPGEGASSGVAYLAHLGGVAFGWLWFRRPTGPSVERVRQRVAAAPDVTDEPPRPVPKSSLRPRERGSETDEVVEKSKALTAKPQPARPVAPARPTPVQTAATRATALDLVLDKISEQGIGSLTGEERRLLDETSEKLRTGTAKTGGA
jgi:membrane associated rhomboid family serine protease